MIITYDQMKAACRIRPREEQEFRRVANAFGTAWMRHEGRSEQIVNDLMRQFGPAGTLAWLFWKLFVWPRICRWIGDLLRLYGEAQC